MWTSDTFRKGNSKQKNLHDRHPSPLWPSKASRLSSLQFQFNSRSPALLYMFIYIENKCTPTFLESNLSEWQGFCHDDWAESISSFVGLWRDWLSASSLSLSLWLWFCFLGFPRSVSIWELWSFVLDTDLEFWMGEDPFRVFEGNRPDLWKIHD